MTGWPKFTRSSEPRRVHDETERLLLRRLFSLADLAWFHDKVDAEEMIVKTLMVYMQMCAWDSGGPSA